MRERSGDSAGVALSNGTVRWILTVGGTLFWLVIGARMAASRRGEQGAGREAATSDPGPTIASTPGALLLWLNGVTMFGNTVALLLWTARPSLIGPALLPTRLPVQIAGIALMAGGIGLMGWAYAVFRSFRLLPQIEAGHELCEDGPFAWLRHPIYLGMNVFYLGTFLLVPRVGVICQVIANAIVLDGRARAEEQVMTRAFGDRYRHFMANTRRYVPGIY